MNLGGIQDQVKQNNSPIEHKNPFFVTYNVDLEPISRPQNVRGRKITCFERHYRYKH